MGLAIPLNRKHRLKTSESAMSSGRKIQYVIRVILSRLQSSGVSEKHLGTTSTSQRPKAPWSTRTDLKDQLLQQTPILAMPTLS